MRAYTLDVLRWLGCFVIAATIIVVLLGIINHYLTQIGMSTTISMIFATISAVLAHFWWRAGFLTFRWLRDRHIKTIAPSSPARGLRYETALVLRAIGTLAAGLSFIALLSFDDLSSASPMSFLPLPLLAFFVAWIVAPST